MKKKLLCKFVNLYGLISSPFIFKVMDKINAVITGVGGYVPEDVLTNEDISKMVDTTDEWIMTRVGIKERRILKGEGVGLSYMGIRAVKQLLEKTNLNPEEVEVVLTATTTPDLICKVRAQASCMLWRRALIIFARGVIRRWLSYRVIR